MSLDALRRDYHQALCAQILYVDANDAPNFADKHSRPSVALAQGIVKKLPYPHCPTPLSGQTVGSNFENITRNFLAQAFSLLEHLRPGKWQFFVHASISCKWTFRSDRSQNARTEGLNLIRNRKGHTPHIAIVTAESYPQRLASVALGTGDIDCVYHIALPELQETVKEYDNPAVTDMLDTLIEGRRLRDISDLPFDLIT